MKPFISELIACSGAWSCVLRAQCPCIPACFPGAGSPIMAVRGCAAGAGRAGYQGQGCGSRTASPQLPRLRTAPLGPSELHWVPQSSPGSLTAPLGPSEPPAPASPRCGRPRLPWGCDSFGVNVSSWMFPAHPARSAACVRITHRKGKGWKSHSTGSRSWSVDEQKVEGGRTAAVPSFAPEQTFLQKCVDCAFNRLDEEKSLHGRVCGLAKAADPSPQLHEPCCHWYLREVSAHSATTNARFTQASQIFLLSSSFLLHGCYYTKKWVHSLFFSIAWFTFIFIFFSFSFLPFFNVKSDLISAMVGS